MSRTGASFRQDIQTVFRRLLFALALAATAPAFAGGQYLWWFNVGGMYGPSWVPSTTDISTAYNTKPSLCPGPSYDDGLIGGGPERDANGTTAYLSVRYTGCRDERYNPMPDFRSGSTMWALTTCNPGFVPGKPEPARPLQCLPDIASAAQADATNEHGTPPDCAPCMKQFLAATASNSVSNGQVEGDPVNAATGNELVTEDDYFAAGSSLLSLSRHYNSGVGVLGSGLLGPGWSYNYRYRALIGDAAGSAVVLVRPDGASVQFTFDNAQGKYVASSRDDGKLSRTLSAGYLASLTYTRADGTQEQYAPGFNVACSGCINKIIFGQGGQLTFAWSGANLSNVADNRGHILKFTYGSVGGMVRITKATLPDGTFVNYGYDAQGLLTSAGYADGTQRTYEYTGTVNRPLLTKLRDGNGSVEVTVIYDSQGRATSTKLGSNAQLTTFAYGGGSTVVTNSLGTVKTMTFASATTASRAQTSGLHLSCTNGCGPAGALDDSFEYTTSGNLASVTDKFGIKTCYSFDTVRNLPLKVVEGVSAGAACAEVLASPPGSARVRTWQWHAMYAVPMSMTGPQRKTFFNYDSLGRMLTQTEVETNDLSVSAVSRPYCSKRCG